MRNVHNGTQWCFLTENQTFEGSTLIRGRAEYKWQTFARGLAVRRLAAYVGHCVLAAVTLVQSNHESEPSRRVLWTVRILTGVA